MRRILRILVRAIAVLALLAAAAVAYAVVSVGRRVDAVHATTVPAVPAAGGPEAVARGRYLVTSVATCIDCHDTDFTTRTSAGACSWTRR
jgi:hypothetical protein